MNSVGRQYIDLESVFPSLPGANLLLLPDTPKFTIVSVTDDYLQLTNHKKEELLGKGIFEIFPDNPGEARKISEEALRSSLAYILETKQSRHFPLQRYDVRDTNGLFRERYWSATEKAIEDDSGNVVYILHHIEDVTPQVKFSQRELELQSIERAYSHFMHAPVAVCIVSSPGYTIELVNKHMLNLIGRSPEIVGKQIEETLTEAGLQGLLALFDKVSATNKSVHVNFPASIIIDGQRQERFLDMVVQPYNQGNNAENSKSLFCVAYDITPQVVTQQKLAELQQETEQQKRFYETINASTPDLIYVFDSNYRFTYANKALLTTWGTTLENAIGKGLLELGYEPWHAEMHEREIDQVIATKEMIRGEVSFQHAVLGKRMYDYIFAPVINERGEVEAVAGTTRDITEIKRAEDVMKESSEKLEALVAERTTELERSNKDLEDFAYAASHDMKEPIRKIQFFSDRLLQQLDGQLSEEQKRYFERMQNASTRMGTLIDDLLTYSHAAKERPGDEDVDLSQSVKTVLDDLEVEVLEKKANIIVDPLPTIRGNSRQLQQLFQNLLSNALKYSKEDVPPEVYISSRIIKGSEVDKNFKALNRDHAYCLIEVKDNGIGFPQEESERIFKMFTRLHGISEYSGTGVGLSIARKVVQTLGGHIWAESEEEKGARFKVLLPSWGIVNSE